MIRPTFLDEKVLTVGNTASVLGLDADRLLGLLGEDAEPLPLERRDPSDDGMTWAEFTTIALFLRCKAATPFEYTILVGHNPYFAASREAVLGLAKRMRPGADQTLLGRLRSWNVYFDADAAGWAVRYYPGSHRTWPQVTCDGTVETEPPSADDP